MAFAPVFANCFLVARASRAGKAAEPPAKTAWGNARDGAVGFGHTVKSFFTNLFSKR